MQSFSFCYCYIFCLPLEEIRMMTCDFRQGDLQDDFAFFIGLNLPSEDNEGRALICILLSLHLKFAFERNRTMMCDSKPNLPPEDVLAICV